MLSLRDRVDLEAMSIKRYSSFLKIPALLEPHHQIVYCHYQDSRWEDVTPSAEKPPADRENETDKKEKTFKELLKLEVLEC